VDRRAFLTLATGGLLAAPLAARAQQVGKSSPRIGWLSAGAPPDPFLEGFREGLRRLGYVEGQTIDFEIRHARGSLEALNAGAAELAQSNVALIVASLTAIRAARTVKNIPILFTVSGDPVEAGFVQSLHQPRLRPFLPVSLWIKPRTRQGT
jgi:putative tryptophan/tyrosine transport system substrate-binding protein